MKRKFSPQTKSHKNAIAKLKRCLKKRNAVKGGGKVDVETYVKALKHIFNISSLVGQGFPISVGGGPLGRVCGVSQGTASRMLRFFQSEFAILTLKSKGFELKVSTFDVLPPSEWGKVRTLDNPETITGEYILNPRLEALLDIAPSE